MLPEDHVNELLFFFNGLNRVVLTTVVNWPMPVKPSARGKTRKPLIFGEYFRYNRPLTAKKRLLFRIQLTLYKQHSPPLCYKIIPSISSVQSHNWNTNLSVFAHKKTNSLLTQSQCEQLWCVNIIPTQHPTSHLLPNHPKHGVHGQTGCTACCTFNGDPFTPGFVECFRGMNQSCVK